MVQEERKCTLCGTVLPADCKFKRCDDCRRRTREKNRRYLKKKKENNICRNCSEGVIYKSNLCKRCYEIQMNYMNRSIGCNEVLEENEETLKEKELLKDKLCIAINKHGSIPTLKTLEDLGITNHKECYKFGGYINLLGELRDEKRIQNKIKINS